MPISFPMDLDDFLGALPVKSVEFDLPEAVESSRTAGGAMLVSSIGDRLWQGEVNLHFLLPEEAMDAQVLIDLVRGAGASFLAWHTRYAHPRLDPGGSAIAAASPKIGSLDVGDARVLGLKDLPAGYQLRRGDYLSFTWGTTPVRYALHRVVDASVTADGSGSTPDFEVAPEVQPGAQLDAPVRLSRAHCKAIIEPGSVQTGRQDKFKREGMSFRFIQTMR